MTAILALCAPSWGQSIIRVDDDGPPDGDGSSWSMAEPSLSDALAVAKAGDEIWVAQGTYYPEVPGSAPPDATSRSFTFEIPSDVEVYGGFGATELSLDERANLFDRTILSGDLPSGVRAYSVVTIPAGSTDSRLDGFRITGGRANNFNTGLGDAAKQGGGLYASGATFFDISNCTFHDCKAHDGGGAYVSGGSFHMNHTVFEACVAIRHELSDNKDARGGGMFVVSTGADCELHSVVFRDCIAHSGLSAGWPNRGGGIYANDLGGRLTVVNGLFHDNIAGRGGAVAIDSTASPTGLSLINCTLSQNRAWGTSNWVGDGAAVFVESGGLHHTLENTIIWGNIPWDPATDPSTVKIESGSAISGAYLDIDPDNNGTFVPTGTILNTDPLFESPSLDDFTLQTASPAVDAGDNALVPVDVTDLDADLDDMETLPWALKKNYLRIADDQFGNPGTVDMGAHELPSTAGTQ